MKSFIYFVTYILLSSCTIVNTRDTHISYNNTSTLDNKTTITVDANEVNEVASITPMCDLFVLPTPLPIPRSRDLPMELQNDPVAFNELALEYISDLINHIRESQDMLNSSYSTYLNNCRSQSVHN